LSASLIFVFSSSETLSPWSFRSFYGLEGERVGVVAHLRLFAETPVFLGVRFGIFHHAVDLVLAERGAPVRSSTCSLPVRDPSPTRARCRCVDVERDRDLRDATRCRRDAGELERAQAACPVRHVALALEHLDLDAWLVVVGRRERFHPLGRDGGVRSMSLVMI